LESALTGKSTGDVSTTTKGFNESPADKSSNQESDGSSNKQTLVDTIKNIFKF